MAGKKRETEEVAERGDSNAWMVTFSDLLTLMITFFVLLLSMSSMDSKKLEEMFGVFSEAMGPLEMGASKELKSIKEEIKAENIFQEFQPELNAIRSLLSEAMKEEEGISIDKVKGSTGTDKKDSKKDRGVMITLSDVIIFESGKTEISDSAYPILERISGHLKSINYMISINGHTDSSAAGGNSSNWSISAKRAINVMRYFNEVAGIEMERLSARGYGEYLPLVDNSTSENRARNRRIEIVLSRET